MNRTMTSLLAMGAGALVYRMATQSDMLNNRSMKRMRRRITKMFYSDESKAELLPVAYNQKQIVESSAVVAILGDLKANENGEEVYAELASQGYITDEIKQTLLGQINGAYQSEQFARDSAFLNASLAAMQLMIAAKAKGYDTCAIGGFNKEQFQKQFDISERYVPVMLISIGKAVKPAHQSNRLPLSKVSKKYHSRLLPQYPN